MKAPTIAGLRPIRVEIPRIGHRFFFTKILNVRDENLAVSALGLAPNRPFWLRFELRAASQRELSSLVGDAGGISLRGVVEFFSRKSGTENFNWVRTAGPLRVPDLPRTVFHGRIG